jgi:predicted RecB family nuclease
MPFASPALSKSRFMAGLQCLKRLYLECYERQRSLPIDAFGRAVLETGRAVGTLARGRFPGGTLIDPRLDHDRAEEMTRAVLEDRTVPALYEGAFSSDGLRIRVDVLVRARGGRFDLVEVKSTTSVKPEHRWDVAVQLHALEGAGVGVRRAYLVHLNRGYVHHGGEYRLEQLFASEDLTVEARALRNDVRKMAARMRSALDAEEPPPLKVGAHCETPYTCPFYDHCHDGLPPDPFAVLPRVTSKLRARLSRAGIGAIEEIPLDFRGLSLVQRRALEAVRSGKRIVAPGVRRALAKLAFPVHFVDFETLAPAIPLYVGTRPYDAIPVQWSVHVLDRGGRLRHREFLHETADDPRREFALRLLEATRGEGSVVVYSDFEDRRLADLEAALPDLSGDLRKLRRRLFDLLPLVRNDVYDPVFGGSFSMKAVLPAIVPGLGYDELEISDGGLASVALAEMMSPETSPERRRALRRNLLAYCRRDTEALVALFRALR